MGRSFDRIVVGGILVVAAALATPLGRVQAQCTPDWLPGQAYPGVDGKVYAMQVWDDGNGPALYVAGTFEVAGNTMANNIARWDGASFSPLGKGLDGTVCSLTVYGDELIAGSASRTARGTYIGSVTRWNGTNWVPLGGNLEGSITALAVYRGELIAGICDWALYGTAPGNVFRWDGTSWSPLGGGVNAGVSTLTVYNGELIAGGRFTAAGGVPANCIARWNGVGWSPLGIGMGRTADDDMAGLETMVSDVEVYNGELIAAGTFSMAGGVVANGMARWNGTDWLEMGDAMGVHALAVYSGQLIVGQNKLNSDLATGFSCIARWDGANWWPMDCGSTRGGNDGSWVLALAVYKGELVVAGDLTRVGDIPVGHIARWNGTSWAALVESMNHPVTALTVYNCELIAGGYLTTGTDGTGTPSVAHWDGMRWSRLGSGFYGGDALVVHNGDLVALGTFKTSLGTLDRVVARWDGANWSQLGSCAGSAVALTVYHDELVAAFDRSWTYYDGCVPLRHPSVTIARWDGTSWLPLLDNDTSTVYALAVYHDQLMAGGTSVNQLSSAGVLRTGIARWDGASWSPLDNGLQDVYAMIVYNDELIVAGSGVAKWDGASWSPLGGGVGGQCIL